MNETTLNTSEDRPWALRWHRRLVREPPPQICLLLCLSLHTASLFLAEEMSCPFVMASAPLENTELELDILHCFTNRSTKSAEPETLRLLLFFVSLVSLPTPFSQPLWLHITKPSLNTRCSVAVVLWDTPEVFSVNTLCVQWQKNPWKRKRRTPRLSSLSTLNTLCRDFG